MRFFSLLPSLLAAAPPARFQADLTVFISYPMMVPEGSISAIHVVLTVVEGKIAYSNLALAAASQ